MKDRKICGKRDLLFFRLLLLLSAAIHFFLCFFFVWIEIPVMIYYNITSVIFYLTLVCLFGRIRHIQYCMIVLFLEVVTHVFLCNLYLGWGYGFSLYGLMIIPITYYVTYVTPQMEQDILYSSLLSLAALVAIVASCVMAGIFNKYAGFSAQEVMYIFCINFSLCILCIVACSAYFVYGLKLATRELEERNEELDFLAHFDALTNLHNRQNMEDIFEKYEKSGKKYCVALGDLDDFKEKNDLYGYMCGDQLQVHLSYLIRKAVRNYGEVCRWGGDEILLLLKMDQIAGHQLVENIRQQIQDFLLEHKGRAVGVTITWGFAYCDEEENINKLLSLADARLKEGKSKGKNQTVRS